MAAGDDKEKLGNSIDTLNGISPDSEGQEEGVSILFTFIISIILIPLYISELENLANILNQLEECVEKLDEKASSLTDRIKEFLEENQTSNNSTETK